MFWFGFGMVCIQSVTGSGYKFRDDAPRLDDELTDDSISFG